MCIIYTRTITSTVEKKNERDRCVCVCCFYRIDSALPRRRRHVDRKRRKTVVLLLWRKLLTPDRYTHTHTLCIVKREESVKKEKEEAYSICKKEGVLCLSRRQWWRRRKGAITGLRRDARAVPNFFIF